MARWWRSTLTALRFRRMTLALRDAKLTDAELSGKVE
jgi:hypothetical protein